MLWVRPPPACLLKHHTWPVFASALQLCKLLDEVGNADVLHILFKFLMNLQDRGCFYFIMQINLYSFT